MRKKIYLGDAFRAALGSCAAILAAEQFRLDFASSAGIIALLSLLNTRWDTLKIAGFRILSYGMTVLLAWTVFGHMRGGWVSYGVFVFLLVLFCLGLGWKNVLSVNAVIGTHFWSNHDFGLPSIWNEFCLVLIGITAAIFLNLFQYNRSRRREIQREMRDTEEKLRQILGKIADDLTAREVQGNLWEEVAALERHLEFSRDKAYEYAGNTFASHTEYYIRYIDMRERQCRILQGLHRELGKIRTMPVQAAVIADFIEYMKRYVLEHNVPRRQIERLRQTAESFHSAPLPATREEFEGRAVLYHILTDLEEFLMLKKRFVESLSERQLKVYWEQV